MVTKILDRITSKSKEQKIDENNNNNNKIGINEKPTLFGEDDYKFEIVWRNILIFLYLHCCAVYGFTLKKSLISIIIGWITGLMVAFGTTLGAHRLYTHRSYKANKKLQLLLMYMQTMAVQNSMYEWVRDHRVHHKFTDTNADPHNSKRGFFFSHIGWLMCKKHPDVKKFGVKIDMSDLEADPIVMFQHKYYVPLAILIGFVIPISFTCWLGESFHVVYYGHMFRYLMGLNLVWMINSVAHIWGSHPYDKNISATDSYLVGFCGVGEGFHNYHHIFPWDYKAAELPSYWCNLSLALLDFFAYIGWATDLKTVSTEMINKRILRTGDDSHNLTKIASRYYEKVQEHNDIWGWDDKEITEEQKKYVKILYKFHD